MSKLPKACKFIDLSDYGRPIARVISQSLKNTRFTAIHVTIWFIISGLLAVFCIIKGYYILAAFFLILKSILDAADGELARLKNTPSYTGRYLDSVSDIILNGFILLAIWQITNANIWYTVIAFFGIQLQGTLYNYYYVILRNRYNGDKTSRIFEDKTPTALPGETQANVDILFKLYKILYGSFDKAIYMLDRNASTGKILPNWMMTMLSVFGLGFQLLMIAVLLVLGLKEYIIPYFIVTTLLIFGFIAIRKSL
ncbi:MAG: CDP-alcohol phosphatidyltransferase family protein [Winogradskyella sp.]|uniref:CDP-alcohol phosphatidyltransferase family protein n=1 Tax=Winogradskyella sp. TaxID=1883156 RepID=UPI001801D429|nr:CDP-alcohol phosphatidyltransferase family protein [Winogradskyella sp.]MBT8244144.1 CDP-alcohol phosphatidyltransferase family protein [Winogradskyella sp.]NNK23522.1 CDP-alcohol phosphatidyltransferase family protein [Winogradskyella sp.]